MENALAGPPESGSMDEIGKHNTKIFGNRRNPYATNLLMSENIFLLLSLKHLINDIVMRNKIISLTNCITFYTHAQKNPVQAA